MTTIAQVRDKLALVVQTATGLRSTGYVGDQPITPPCARVARREMDPRLIYGGTKASFPFTIAVYAGRAADRAGEKLLDTYTEISGSTSVLAAVETLSNWSGVAIDLAEVTRISEVQVVEIGNVPYLRVEFDVDVYFAP